MMTKARPHHDATSEEFEKGALYFYVRSTVHTNPSQKRSFSKTHFQTDEFENADFAFYFGRETF